MNRKLNMLAECDGGMGGGDAGAPGGAASGIPAGGEGSPIEAPGGCNHSHDGYFGPGCFHAPIPAYGYGIAYGGSKRKKTKKRKSKKYSYEKGIKIIKSYDDLVSESTNQEPWTFVLNIPSTHLQTMIEQSTIENERFDIKQFTKNMDENGQLYEDNYELVGIFGQNTKQCFALALLMYDRVQMNDCYINELMSLRPGFGMKLLNKIIDHTENTWLMADIDAGEDLCNKFYRKNPRLTEIKINGGHVYDDAKHPNRKVLHLFYADNCEDPKKLSSTITNAFMQR